MKSLGCLLLALGACGGSSPNTDPDAPRSDAAPSCTPAQSTTIIMIPTVTQGSSTSYAVWMPVAAAGPAAVLARQDDAAGAIHIARITTSATELASLPTAVGYRFSAAAIPGSDCAIVSSSKAGLSLACPGQPLDTAASVRDIDGGPVFPVKTASSLFVYTQTFASFTELEHASAGTWAEHEQFESSVSFPTDAALAGGLPVACFITAGDRASVIVGGTGGGGSVTSTASAQWCKLAVAGDTIHVLTDAGYGTISLATLQASPGQGGILALSPTPVTSRPQQLVMLDATPHALVLASDSVQLVPVPSGTPIMLPKPIGDATQLSWDPSSRALTEVSYTLDHSGSGPTYPQTITFDTHCVP